MRASTMVAAALLCLVANVANAAGFEASYEVYQGDFNGDGRTDFYVREVPNIVFVDFDMGLSKILCDRAIIPAGGMLWPSRRSSSTSC
jgi:hypothetical protein